MAPVRKNRGKAAAAAAAVRLTWNIGDLVLAKVKGFPHWPARVSNPGEWGHMEDPRKVFVYFFGTEQIAFVQPGDIKAFTPDVKKTLLAKSQVKSTATDFSRAVAEICEADQSHRINQEALEPSKDEICTKTNDFDDTLKEEATGYEQKIVIEKTGSSDQFSLTGTKARRSAQERSMVESAVSGSFKKQGRHEENHNTWLLPSRSSRQNLITIRRLMTRSSQSRDHFVTDTIHEGDGSTIKKHDLPVNQSDEIGTNGNGTNALVAHEDTTFACDPNSLRQVTTESSVGETPPPKTSGSSPPLVDLEIRKSDDTKWETLQQQVLLPKKKRRALRKHVRDYTTLSYMGIPPAPPHLEQLDMDDESQLAKGIQPPFCELQTSKQASMQDEFQQEKGLQTPTCEMQTSKQLDMHCRSHQRSGVQTPSLDLQTIKQLDMDDESQQGNRVQTPIRDLLTIKQQDTDQASQQEKWLRTPTCDLEQANDTDNELHGSYGKKIIVANALVDGVEAAYQVKWQKTRVEAHEKYITKNETGYKMAAVDAQIVDSTDECLPSAKKDSSPLDKEVASQRPETKDSLMESSDASLPNVFLAEGIHMKGSCTSQSNMCLLTFGHVTSLLSKADKNQRRSIMVDDEAALPPSKRRQRAFEAMNACAAEAAADLENGTRNNLYEGDHPQDSRAPSIGIIDGLKINADSASQVNAVIEKPVVPDNLLGPVDGDLKKVEGGNVKQRSLEISNSSGGGDVMRTEPESKPKQKKTSAGLLEKLASLEGIDHTEKLQELRSKQIKGDHSKMFHASKEVHSGTHNLDARPGSKEVLKATIECGKLHFEPSISYKLQTEANANKVREAVEAAKEIRQRRQAQVAASIQISSHASESMKFFHTAMHSPSPLPGSPLPPSGSVQEPPDMSNITESAPFTAAETPVLSEEVLRCSSDDYTCLREDFFTEDMEASTARDTFEGMLETLSRTKDSIARATRQALDCAKYGIADQVVEIIAQRLESEPSFHRRLDLFFLVDSITQLSKGIMGSVYITAVQAALPRLLHAAAPPGTVARENRRQCLKVLNLWIERSVMPSSILMSLISELESNNNGRIGSFHRLSRFERAVDDPIREMEGLLFDEYGSNATFGLTGLLTRIFESADGFPGAPEKIIDTLNFVQVVREPTFSPCKKHRHILEDVEGELEMEDASPDCSLMKDHIDDSANPAPSLELHPPLPLLSIQHPPPLPDFPPPSPPPLPSSPPPLSPLPPPPLPPSSPPPPPPLPPGGPPPSFPLPVSLHVSSSSFVSLSSTQPLNTYGVCGEQEVTPSLSGSIDRNSVYDYHQGHTGNNMTANPSSCNTAYGKVSRSSDFGVTQNIQMFGLSQNSTQFQPVQHGTTFMKTQYGHFHSPASPLPSPLLRRCNHYMYGGSEAPNQSTSPLQQHTSASFGKGMCDVRQGDDHQNCSMPEGYQKYSFSGEPRDRQAYAHGPSQMLIGLPATSVLNNEISSTPYLGHTGIISSDFMYGGAGTLKISG